MSQRKAGTILSYIYFIVSNGISLIYTPYMLRMMGQGEYGLYGTANSFVSYLSVLSFGIGGAYIRFNAKYRAANDLEGERRLNGMFLTIFSLLSLLVFVGGIGLICLAGPLTHNTFSAQELFKLRVMILLLTLNTICTFIFNVVMMALMAYEKFIIIRGTLLLTAIITPILNIIALNIGGRAISITAISVSVSIITYLIYYIYAKRTIGLKFSFKGFQFNVMKEIFVFSSFLFINSITDQITTSTDQVILSAVKGATSVAVYTIGSSFRLYFMNFSTSISGVFAPQVNMIVAKSGGVTELNQLFIKIGRIQFYILSLVLIGYSLIGKEFVLLWAGQDYEESFWIGLLLMASTFVPCFQNVGIEIQKAMNKHKARSIAYLLVALVNIVLTIPFAKHAGGIGAAFATFLCVVLGQVVFMNFYYEKYILLDILAFWKSIGSIIPGYIIPVAIGLILKMGWEVKSFFDVFIIAVIITFSFCVSVWFISMNSYEKELIKRIVGKLFREKKWKS